MQGHRGCVEDEEKEVDEDAGDGDVEPERKGPAGDGFVAAEASAQRERQSDEHERNDDCGEDGMADEKREIRGANGAVAGKRDDSGVSMEVEIGDEEGDGTGDGGQHADFVLKDLAAANEDVAGREKHSAGGVKTCIQARKRSERNQAEDELLSAR